MKNDEKKLGCNLKKLVKIVNVCANFKTSNKQEKS